MRDRKITGKQERGSQTLPVGLHVCILTFPDKSVSFASLCGSASCASLCM